MTGWGNLTRGQKRALAALLAERTITQAAVTSGIPERTIYRYLANPVFRSALTQAETATIDEAGRRLLAGQDAALDALETIITGPSKDSDKRLAAAAWLDFVMRWRELRNTEERLANLEKAVFNKGE